MEKSPLLGRLDVGTVPASRLSRDSSFRGRGGRLRRREYQASPRVTTSGALIADSRRAFTRDGREVGESHGRTTNCWRWLVSDATRTVCSHFAPITSRNRTKQEQVRRINRKRGTADCRTLFPRDQRVTGHGRLVLITQRSLVQIQPPQPENQADREGRHRPPLSTLRELSEVHRGWASYPDRGKREATRKMLNRGRIPFHPLVGPPQFQRWTPARNAAN